MLNKRILAVILVFVMMLSQFNVVLANETNDYEKSWAKNDISEWIDSGYVTTYKDGKFKPKQNITRAEFIQVINKAFDIPETEEIVEFTDVTEKHMFFKDIQKGESFGYIGGYPDGSFKPEGHITREEASKIISVMLGVYKYHTDYVPEIKDYDKIGDWAKEHVKFLITKGVIKGYPDGNFMGKNNITRQEAVAILKRMHTVSTNYTGIEVAAIDRGSLVKNATIKLYTDEYELIKEEPTDESGYLKIKGIKPGDYFVKIEDENNEKIYSQKVAVKDKFVTYKQAEIQNAVKVTGLLIDQDGKKASPDIALVFISQSQFITHTLENGIIETSLLPDSKYTVFVKQDKLEKVGEVSIEDGNVNIGTLKYTKTDKKEPIEDDNATQTPAPTPKPEFNDKALPIIKLDTSGLQEYMNEDMYIVDEKLDAINGSITANSNITKLEYAVNYGELNIEKQLLSPSKEFTIENLAMPVGLNTLTIVATDSHDNSSTYSIELINTSEENSVGIILDTGDEDGDGLLNYEELYYGTNPKKPDTDGDGLTDYEEIMITLTNPLESDTDGNGILDGDEDFDSDGLTNLQEIKLNGNPYSDDTDYDGLKDGQEAILGTKLDAWDTDEDGLSDSKEIELGTDPLNPDTNENGILDGNETFTIEKTPDLRLADPNVIPTIEMDLPASLIDSLSISAIPKDDIYLPSEMPGYIGAGYEFELGGEFEKAILTFAYNPSFSETEDFEPAIYYYDEENQDMIFLEDQEIDLENHKISVEIEHFSKYILINNTEYLKVWEEEIRLPSEGDLNKPLDIVLVIDSSGSMTWNDPDDLRKQVTKEFVEKLGEDDRVAIVDFDSYAHLLTPFTRNKDTVKTAIDRIDSSGGTNLTAGINMALNQFKVPNQNIGRMGLSSYFQIDDEFGENGLDINGNSLLLEEVGLKKSTITNTTEASIALFNIAPLKKVDERDSLKYIIMLTDGEGPYNKSLTQQAMDNDIVIHTVGLGNSLDVKLLSEIASKTGGRYFVAASATDLMNEFENIAGEVIDLTKDSDGDGLADYYETKLRYSNGIKINTDVDKRDTDGDGLLDGEEIKIHHKEIVKNGEKFIKVYATIISNPTMIDTDGDGYTDYMEVKYNPHAGAGKYNPLKWDVSDRDLAILAQTSYSKTLREEDFLDKVTDNDIDEQFYETALIKEMKGWELLEYYSERNGERDTDYGGFSYSVYGNKDNIVLAFRGSQGKHLKSVKDKLGDWYNNDLKYSMGKDPGVNDTEGMMAVFIEEYIENKAVFNGKKVYITGHSRGGMLAQLATAQLVQKGKINKIEGLAYFNAMGVVFNSNSDANKIIYDNLNSAKRKVKGLRIKGAPKGDAVSKLGKHVVSQVEYDITQPALDNYGDYILAPHAMCNFTYHLRPERYNEISK